MKEKMIYLTFIFFVFSLFVLSFNAYSSYTFKLTNNSINDRDPKISADGSKIVWVYSTNLYLINADGTGFIQLTTGGQNGSPSICGDGSKIAYQGVGLHLYIINSDGTGLQQITNDALSDGPPSISDDCTKIAFTRSSEIYIINSDGAGLSRLTNNGYTDTYPNIGGDGSRVAFSCNEGKPSSYYEVCVVKSDGSGWQRLTNDSNNNANPSISYNGKKITFRRNINDLMTINSDGTGYNNIYIHPTTLPNPQLSGDGTKIAFGSRRINYDGTGLFQYIPSGVSPSITYNGHRIAFYASDGDNEIYMWDEFADPIATLSGTNISVSSTTNGMGVTYASVSSGCTTIFTYNPGGQKLPSGKWAGLSNLHYFISTTCSYTWPVEVTIDYNEGDFFNEPALRLYHWSGSDWLDVTTNLDVISNQIIGQVAGLSEFVIMENEPPPLPESRAGSQLINYQGRLLNGSGVPITDSVAMTFSLYDGATSGTSLWSEIQGVQVNGGIYNVLLGGLNPLIPSLFARPYVYLGVQAGADAEISPRQQITAVPMALTIDGQRIEKGTAALSVSGTSSGVVNVSYAQPFISLPHVTIGGLSADIGGQAFVLTKITNKTITGFSAEFRSLSGASASGSANFDWIAIGQ